MSHHESPRIWTFDSARESQFNTPSPEALVSIWRRNHGQARVLQLTDGYYGVCEIPDEKPAAIISLDLCEIVRETGNSVARMYGHDLTSAHYGEQISGLEDNQALREKIVFTAIQELIHNKIVTPVPYAEAIHTFLRNWRAQGVYILANTSTHEGCEPGTIRFLDEHYPGAAQGILFPRNHDGNGSITKARILQEAKDEIDWQLGSNLDDVPTIAIEDALHHGLDYKRQGIPVFMPAYSWNEPLEHHKGITRVEQRFGTADTFAEVDQHLRKLGIVK